MPPEYDSGLDAKKWQFWIDRGGTFTDIVAQTPEGEVVSHKLLSENPERYPDAALEGIRQLLGLNTADLIPAGAIEAVKMGTTVATNALLERKGEPTVLVTTKGFKDSLRIGYQNRPRLFDRHIQLPEMLYSRVIETEERISAHGNVLVELDEENVQRELRDAFQAGFRSAAIVFMHAYRYPDHEKRVAQIARGEGFTQISVSHQISPLIKLVSRGDTTVVDAYLSPILRRYVDRVALELGDTRLMFMQSNGGLTDARLFQGKDSILSGPAGGVVGMVRTAGEAGFDKVIGFDMGGTSTDVSHYDGVYERAFETQVAGVRMRAPMMNIHTVAAGGGSILHFDGARYRVGPDSAGAVPGPASYRRGGPLAVTDCNVMLGKIQAKFFPHVFGLNGDEALDFDAVNNAFTALAEEIERTTGDKRTPQQVAEGFLAIAIENMANAIKQISVQRGYDITEYALNCFGGAGGQHACLVADALGMSTVFVHPLAGVLSAYGMGLAEMRSMRERSTETPLSEEGLSEQEEILAELENETATEIENQGVSKDAISIVRKVHIRYDGTDTALMVDYQSAAEMAAAFEAAHRKRFGFVMSDHGLVIETLSVEAIGATDQTTNVLSVEAVASDAPPHLEITEFVSSNQSHQAPVFDREAMPPGSRVQGPAIIVEKTGTTIVEPGWRAETAKQGQLILSRWEKRQTDHAIGTGLEDGEGADPVMLEIFNNLFMSIAEQMGAVLANTAYSVNIKERLDFSCAVFDRDGGLVANAPHMPVHLGSMGESVQTVIRERGADMNPGDVSILNAPYNGGTHLPDITLITPVFDDDGKELLFFVASRGHHADIGGVTPGSMPPDSTSVEEEGVLIDNFLLVDKGHFRESEMRELLASGPYPARNPDQNMADLMAQLAANKKGVKELMRMVDHFGLDVVQAYMRHVQDNAEESVRRVLDVLKDGSFTYEMDSGAEIKVAISIDKKTRSATVDFTGTSDQQPTNFNAPSAVTRAAVLYVFRTLVDDEIPMNEGCLKPIKVIVPEGSMLNPHYPAAVVAGNVETSQAIVDTLYGALKVMAASQGTMNNLTFGNDQHQYYETICGGTGAGPDFDGTDAVHTHMTNSRLTDPEVLEWRFPVLLEDFTIRKGSGGSGNHKGGDGTIRRLRFLEPMTAAILSGHRKIPPYGMAEGEPGACGHNRLERCDGSEVHLDETGQVEANPGDVFVVETPGGGGYGKE